MADRLPVAGYEGFYEVDSEGKVFGLARIVAVKNSPHKGRTLKGCELKPGRNENGYMSVSLTKGLAYISKNHKVHRLVAMAFHKQSFVQGMDVNHKNGIRNDNRAENLEWMTRSDNHRHKFQVLGSLHGMTGRLGKHHHLSISVQALKMDGSVAYEFGSYGEAHRAGFQASSICDCLQGKQKTHLGYQWVKTPASINSFA